MRRRAIVAPDRRSGHDLTIVGTTPRYLHGNKFIFHETLKYPTLLCCVRLQSAGSVLLSVGISHDHDCDKRSIVIIRLNPAFKSIR